jgi:hypothetical protein
MELRPSNKVLRGEPNQMSGLRKFLNVLLLVPMLVTMPVTAAENQKPEIVVVYWSSQDCKWCTWWESSMSGMEKGFKESPEFKLITYRVVKNDRLANPYLPEHFPRDIQWVYELYQQGEKHPGRPGWAVYVDKKRVAQFHGANAWHDKNFPGLKRVINEHAAK